ncbi:prolyl oligopeptidase family serine peptidase [Neolewinella lacunae]|uniref:S9 family peptidase n=1 Tax=Neolewinella lacunae TaxID=1517758 RepID=A0A923T9I6_9BACT|nr:prolyl oligopeptidase family serine peptidase [Neolewinella lacunae]MBC6995606.1 S9 family peptidase [Neolewinella lacunae]MDN3635642.1 prolyl oligopeptidase family serine peptidase [Neolewinella lacunae]
MPKSLLPLVLALLFGGLPCTCVRAQQAALPGKKAITVEDMQAWKQIENEVLSADGSYVLYTLQADVGDPVAVLYHPASKAERRIPRLHQARLNYEGTHLIGLLKPSLEKTRSIKLSEKKKAKEKLAEMDSLLVWKLGEATPTIIPHVYNFKTGERWGTDYAYTTTSALPDSLRKGLDKDAKRLVVRSYTTQDSFYLEGVLGYVLARDQPMVLAHQAAKDSSWQEGVLYLDTRTLPWKALQAGGGSYTGLALSHDGLQAAFLSAEKDSKDPQKPFHLHHWRQGSAATKVSADPGAWLPSGYRISDDRTPYFSDNGDYLYFGTTPRRPERDTTLLDDEVADVEVWRTEDPRLYTQENVRLKEEQKRTYLAVYRTKTGGALELATPERPYEYLPRGGNGPYALVYDDRPYAKSSTWEGFPSARNTTLINLANGQRQAMLDGELTPVRWLEGGQYLVWYNPTDTTWNSFDPATGQAHVLTTNATGIFYDERNDQPAHPDDYGYAGTLRGGKAFLVYDRYDLWQLDPSGKSAARRLTRGREAGQTYRLQDLDPENHYVDPAVRQLVSVFYQDTYHGGFGWLNFSDGKVSILQSGPKSYGSFTKARLADRYLYTQGDFREFPDLRYTADLGKAAPTISRANPQQEDFAWGTAERYQWIDNQGRTLSGILVKPDGFDPTKQYPLLVNYYERSSESVYSHRTPVPGRSSINYAHYVSKGYLIFNPDVIYRVGYPGESAYDCVMSGVTSLLGEGFVDRKRIGMQGHSWGGYQAAYLVTKTDLFAAVEAGAPVVNMFSAYGGIRWGTGVSRQFQYERTQSRIGGSPWEYPLRYLENSPLFTTDKINTPLLILHNDADGAVPWYQGIEWFTALRRLGKPAWMLNYRGEPHWPVKAPNRADFQTRMAQFFDYYLQDAPMPKWMAEGVSPIERGIEQNLELEEK